MSPLGIWTGCNTVSSAWLNLPRSRGSGARLHVRKRTQSSRRPGQRIGSERLRSSEKQRKLFNSSHITHLLADHYHDFARSSKRHFDRRLSSRTAENS